MGSPSYPNAGWMPTKTLPNPAPSTKIEEPSLCWTPGAGPHCPSDLRQPTLAPHMFATGMRACTLACAPEPFAVALDDLLAQFVDGGRDFDPVALALHRDERLVQRCEDRQIGGGSRVARIGREV